MKTGQNVSVEPTLASRLSSIVIFLAILCCLVPGEIENLVIPYLTVLAIVTLLISVMGRKNRAPSIGKNSTKMAQQWFLGFAIFALGYTLSLICGVYGSRHGFDLNAREVAFYCRLLLVPILSFLWLQFQFAWSRQIFFGLTLAFCTFGLWGLAQFLNASFHWELTLFSFSGPLDSGAARLYHHRPIAFAWQLSLWLIPGFFLLKLNREFISRSVPVWLFKFSLLTTFLAGLATGNRSFVVLSFVALVTEGYLSIGSSLKKKPVKSSLVIAATLLALMIFSPGMSRLKNFEQGSAGGFDRAAVFQAQARAFLSSPLYGVGRSFNRFALYSDFLPEHPFQGPPKAWNAHNLLLDLLASMGLLGTVGFLAIFFPAPRRTSDLIFRKSQNRPNWLKIWCLSTLVWFCFSMIQSPLETPNMLMIAVLLASYLNSKLLSNAQHKA